MGEVSKISDFTLTSSGTCPGDRPKDKKKDTKFVPTCTAGDVKAAIHPFRDVKSWFKCLCTITGAVQLDPGTKGEVAFFVQKRSGQAEFPSRPCLIRLNPGAKGEVAFFCTETIGSGIIPCQQALPYPFLFDCAL